MGAIGRVAYNYGVYQAMMEWVSAVSCSRREERYLYDMTPLHYSQPSINIDPQVSPWRYCQGLQL